MADNFDNLKFQDASKVAIFSPPNIYILHCHSKSGHLYYLFERKWHKNILNLENLEFYTCTLWDHNAKFLIKVDNRNSWVPNDFILVAIKETK